MRKVWIGASLSVAILAFFPAWVGSTSWWLPGIAFGMFVVFLLEPWFLTWELRKRGEALQITDEGVLRRLARGDSEFVLGGSGHIAGVVNPPAAQKYQYWVNGNPCDTLNSFVEGATEHKGSWWPDWLEWLKAQDPETVKAEGARIPGKGKLKAIEDAPGSYVKAR